MDASDLQVAASQAGTRIVGHMFEHVVRTGSTNDDLKRRARDGAPEGLALSADEQTSGRGRRGRSWLAPPGSSLLLSILLRPTWLAPTDAFLLTILGAVSGAEAVEASFPSPPAAPRGHPPQGERGATHSCLAFSSSGKGNITCIVPLPQKGDRS